MEQKSYLNFDLFIETKGERYVAKVIDSPAGQSAIEFDAPFSPLELENLVLRMGQAHKGFRRIDSPELEAAKFFGSKLFQTIFTDDVGLCFQRSKDYATNLQKGIRIRLRINIPEFHDYPWEFLFNTQLNQFLALSKDTPLVRYLELPYPGQVLSVIAPLKILVLISSPDGYEPIDVESEWESLNLTLQPLIGNGLVSIERLRQPTLSALQQRLRQGDVHIFHFVGHGKFLESKQDGMLLLEDEFGKGKPISGQYLGTLLHDHHALRLVVLNACEGARTSQEDPYAGVAQTLVQQGIPAVIAMQFAIFESAALTFAREFYGAIADGYPVDAALSEARKAIFASGNNVEWGTPVLFTRTPDGKIFNLAMADAETEKYHSTQEFAQTVDNLPKKSLSNAVQVAKKQPVLRPPQRKQTSKTKKSSAVIIIAGIIGCIGIACTIAIGVYLLPSIFPIIPKQLTHPATTIVPPSPLFPTEIFTLAVPPTISSSPTITQTYTLTPSMTYTPSLTSTWTPSRTSTWTPSVTPTWTPSPFISSWGTCTWVGVERSGINSHQPISWCQRGSFIVGLDLDRCNCDPLDSPVVGQAQCCAIQNASVNSCKWYGVLQAGINSHQPNAWCPNGSYITGIDFDRANYDPLDSPVIGQVECCSLQPPASKWSFCNWYGVEVSGINSHQPKTWCPQGSLLVGFDLDRKGDYDPLDSPVVGQAYCCSPGE